MLRVSDRLDRRNVLKGLAFGSVASLAGCTLVQDGAEDEDLDPVQERVEVDPDDVVEGGTFRAAISAGPDSFDYPYSSSAEASILHNLVFEGMIATDATGEMFPWLAESYGRESVQDVDAEDYADYMRSEPYVEDDEGNRFLDPDEQVVVAHPDNDPSDDEGQVLTVEEAPDAIDDGTYGMQFTFDLHEGIEFHDGEELTAENVVTSYERLEGSFLSGQVFDSLLDVRADGDTTVNLYAQEPDAAAIRELGGFPIYPSSTVDLPAQEMDPRHGNAPLGTGPWEFDEFEDEEYAVFVKNGNYWFDTELKDWFDGDADFPNQPAIDEVDVRFVPDDAQRAAAVRDGEIDMTYGLTASTLDDYQSDDGFRTAATDGAGFTFLQFPVRIEPWDDARLRRGVNHLIPRETISEEIFSGWETPAWIPIPPVARREGATDYETLTDELREYNEYDTDEAEAEIEEAIDENDIETPIEVTLETNSENDDRVRTMQLIQESMNRTEYFEASLETTEFNTLIPQLQSPEYYDRGRLVFISLSSGFDPHGYVKSIHHPDNFAQCCNFQNIDDEDLNELLRDARYGVDVVEDDELRQERYEDVWERVLELNGNSYGTHSTLVGVLPEGEVHGFNTYPSAQDVIGYGLYTPMDEQITYIDR